MSQPLIKSSTIDTLPFLDQTQKKQYKDALDKLWADYDSAPQNSQQKGAAHQRLSQASQKIMVMMTQKGRPGGVAQVQRPQQNTQGGGSSQNIQQVQNAQQMPGQVQAQGQMPQQGTDLDNAIRARIGAEVNAMTIYPLPEHNSNAQYEAHKTQFKSSFASYRYKIEKAKENLANIQRQFTQMQQAGQQPSQEAKVNAGRMKSAHDQMQQQVQMLIDQNNRAAQAVAARKAIQANRQTPVNGDGLQRPTTQQGLQQQQQQTAQDATTATPTQPQAPLSTLQNVTQQRPQQPLPPTQNAVTPQPPRPIAQQAPPQPQAPQRPPINAQVAQQYSTQYSSAPNSAMPQSAGAPQQRPLALSQQGAIAKAQEQNYQQNAVNPQQTPSQAQQPGPNGVSFGVAPSQSTPATPTPTQPALNSKFPIPKTLNLSTQTQTAVPGANPRPTMMNHGGMMGVPGVQKPPQFTLEGEGDHVLSKRKLDELVRQVTGSSNPADGLTPEVEEAVLSLTDDFIDNVISKACQMAKLRQGQTLEVRDIQIVLERNYGIRIPGYSLDEVRAVRKFQPGPGWIAKVQAVQAGKVMGSTRDA